MALDQARAAVRRGIQAQLRDWLPLAQRQAPVLLLIACSGGADSLALAAAASHLQDAKEFQGRLRFGAVIVDHQLQAGSASVAKQAADQCRALGLEPVQVETATVERAENLESAARNARYRALGRVAKDLGALAVLTGHTRDDQAETVLLSLARGSGLSALRGMAACSSLTGLLDGTPSGLGELGAAPECYLLRPLLDVTRAETVAACAADELSAWADPMNADPSYRRVAVRKELIPLAERVLGGGFGAALARTAALVRSDHLALETWADETYTKLRIAPLGGQTPGQEHPNRVQISIPVDAVQDCPQALRSRLWLRAAREVGSGGELSHRHLAAVDALVTDWRGQGLTYLPSKVTVSRLYGKIVFHGTRV